MPASVAASEAYALAIDARRLASDVPWASSTSDADPVWPCRKPEGNANGPADVCSETKDGASEGEERTFSARRTSAGEFIVVRVDCASGIRDSRPGKYPVMLLMVSPHIKLCGTVVLTTIR